MTLYYSYGIKDLKLDQLLLHETWKESGWADALCAAVWLDVTNDRHSKENKTGLITDACLAQITESERS